MVWIGALELSDGLLEVATLRRVLPHWRTSGWPHTTATATTTATTTAATATAHSCAPYVSLHLPASPYITTAHSCAPPHAHLMCPLINTPTAHSCACPTGRGGTCTHWSGYR